MNMSELIEYNMDTNKEYWEKITAYYSGDLNDSDKADIEAWAEKQDGKELLMNMEIRMKQAEKASFMYNSKTDLAWDKLSNRIEQSEDSKKVFRFRKRNLIGIAASVIVLLAVGFGLIKLAQNTLQVNHIQTAFNQESVELPDGTLVSLNGNSSIEYPSVFKGKTRSIKLAGEAFFDVKPDKEHPFIIETDQARIQVLGTSFNVRTDNQSGDVEVFVNSGKVQFQDIINPKQMLILEKGDFASLKNQKMKTQVNADVNYLSWKSKMLEFNQTPLNEVVHTLNRAYAVQIELESDAMNQMLLTSKYNQLDVDALLKAMCLTFNINQKKIDNRIILYSSTP